MKLNNRSINNPSVLVVDQYPFVVKLAVVDNLQVVVDILEAVVDKIHWMPIGKRLYLHCHSHRSYCLLDRR